MEPASDAALVNAVVLLLVLLFACGVCAFVWEHRGARYALLDEEA